MCFKQCVKQVNLAQSRQCIEFCWSVVALSRCCFWLVSVRDAERRLHRPCTTQRCIDFKTIQNNWRERERVREKVRIQNKPSHAEEAAMRTHAGTLLLATQQCTTIAVAGATQRNLMRSPITTGYKVRQGWRRLSRNTWSTKTTLQTCCLLDAMPAVRAASSWLSWEMRGRTIRNVKTRHDKTL